MIANRLAGHELRREGAPFAKTPGGGRGRYEVRSTNIGQALCSCGVMSDVLDSNTKRKKWHRDHKDDIRRAQGVQP